MIGRGTPESLRYERKFVVGGARGSQTALAMLLRLHPAMFSEIYAERFVNSIYYDTFDRRHYEEGEAGLSDRTKVRVRWYGVATGIVESPAVEFKIKHNTLGTKQRLSLEDASITDFIDTGRFARLLERSGVVPGVRAILTALRPSLLNRYRRRYYLSACGRFRVTVDTDLEYARVWNTAAPAMGRSSDRVNTVVELKYALEDDTAARWIVSRFPFRADRNSKYVIGLNRLGQ
jgi:VTC domain